MSTSFYEIANYPIPQPQEKFHRIKESDQQQTSNTNRSRTEKPSPIMNEYLEYIISYERLYRSLPFVEHIYLCNSITFNALHEGSDIDILIITKPGSIWLARARSWLIFSIIGIKRFGSASVKKFCLSFYIDREQCNLYHTALQPYDIYLCYRIAHLVPLYSSNTSYINQIYSSNHWITHFLPNLHSGQNIYLGIETITGETIFKRFIEGLYQPSLIHRYATAMIKYIRSPILHYKTAKLQDKGWGIIISDSMLKFYHDRRKRFNYQYKQFTQPFEKKETFENDTLF